MGYYSALHPFVFSSQLMEEELKKRYEDFMNAQDEDTRSYLEIYDFELLDRKDGAYRYSLRMDDYYAKHYALEKLAEFVSRVILPGTYTEIVDDGEDGERGGYLVLRDEVHQLTWYPMVGDTRLDDFVKQKNVV